MKKTVLITFLVLLFFSLNAPDAFTAEFRFGACPSPIGQVQYNCCVYVRSVGYNPESCELYMLGEKPVRMQPDVIECSECPTCFTDWRGAGGGSDVDDLTGDQGESIGGCNGSPAYFSECSPVYEDATSFSSQFSGMSEWWYFTSTGSDGGTYMCMSGYTDSGGTQAHRTSGYHEVDPTSSSDCVSENALAAMNNNSTDLTDPSGCGQSIVAAHNTGISTTYNDPYSTSGCGYGVTGCDVVAEEKSDGKLGGNPSGCGEGAPVWEVNMVNMNLFVTDTPMWHDPPIGPSVKMQVSYNSQAAVVPNAPFGNKWVFRYSSYLHEDSTTSDVTVYMPDGREDVYTSDGGSGYINETGVLKVLTKTAANDFQIEFPDGTVYVYNRVSTIDSEQTLLTGIRDAYDQSLTLTYVVATDRIDKITDASLNDYTFSYGGDDLVDQITDSFTRVTTFDYTGTNLTTITDMGGYSADFTYDGNSYLESLTNNNGETWRFKIEPDDGDIANSSPYPAPGEAMGNTYRITVTDPLTNKEEYFYYGPYSWYVSPRDYVPYTAVGSNNYATAPKTIYYFNRGVGNGKIGRIVTPEGGRTDYRDFHAVSGKPEKIKDFHGDTAPHLDANRHLIEYTYNPKGFVKIFTDAKGNVITYDYFSNDIDLKDIFFNQETDPLKSFTYNPGTHDVATVTDRLDIVTEFVYLTNGQLDKIINAKGSTTTPEMETSFSYDPTSRNLTEIKKNGNIVSSFTYDDNTGRVDTSTDDKGLILAYDYDDLDRVTTTTWPDTNVETTVYSGCCPRLIESKTDRAGKLTTFIYNELKRLKTIQGPAGTIKFEYDKNGNRKKLIDQDGKETAFTYDLDNRLTVKTYADGKTETYTYDSAGLITQIERARSNLTIDYTDYDENHNLETINYSDTTPDVAYTYDNYDRKDTMTDGIGTYDYGYDLINRLTSIDGPWADDDITYGYNDLSHVKKMTVEKGPSTSTVTDYYYDYDTGYADLDLGRLKEIKVGGNTYAYGYTGVNPLIQSLTRPNNSTTDYIHNVDPLKRLTTIDNQDSTPATINKHVFTYNNDLIDTETVTTGIALDAFAEGMKEYNYNNSVNQLDDSTNPNQIFDYDDDGNMIQGFTPDGYQFTLTYDAENRLKTVAYSDGVDVHLTEFYYSGDGMLAIMKKLEDSNPVSETRFVRSGFLPIQERDDSNTVTREYTWGLDKGGGIGGLLGLKEGASDYYYLYDGKGNVMAVLDSNQDVVASYRYDEFGNLLKQGGTLDQPFMFSTKRYDEATGLSYYGYRFYSPAIGRWLTRDPLGEAGGINLYGFVNNNAVNFVDPLGLSLEVLGSSEEQALINSWINTLANCDSDTEISDRLQVIIDSPILFTIQFSDTNLIRAGQYKDYNVTLDKTLMDPNQTDFFYNTPVFSKYDRGYYGGPDTIAHELLGHGFDAANGDYGNNQRSAINIANKVRDYLRKPRRGGWFDK